MSRASKVPGCAVTFQAGEDNSIHTNFFVGPLIPLFWTSGNIPSGFQSQSGQPYSGF